MRHRSSSSQSAFLHLILPRVATELADDRCPRHILLRERGHDALDVRPFPDDQVIVRLARRPDQPVPTVVARMVEPDQASHLFVQVAITGSELVPKRMQDPEVDLVGAVRVGRVPLRLDVRRVVVEQIEHIVAFVLVRADDGCVDRHMVGDDRAGAHALFQTKILGRVPGVEGVDLRV